MLHTSAPTFSLPDQNGTVHTLSDYRGQKVLIFFYPKDDTPGCTTEACSFRDHMNVLKGYGVQVLGISKDTIASHKKFAEKQEFNFPLLSDTDGHVCDDYGVWQEKLNFGRTYWGIKRESFLIDEAGNIMKHYTAVTPATHVQQVIQDLNNLT